MSLPRLPQSGVRRRMQRRVDVRRAVHRGMQAIERQIDMTNYGIQMPEGVQVEEADDRFGRFVIQPLERGYGVTIGNALRRVLLSSLQGIAITAIKIEGVQHEFSTVPGVTEDVADVILNLKGVRFKAEEAPEANIHLSLQGPGHWTAADIAEALADQPALEQLVDADAGEAGHGHDGRGPDAVFALRERHQRHHAVPDDAVAQPADGSEQRAHRAEAGAAVQRDAEVLLGALDARQSPGDR